MRNLHWGAILFVLLLISGCVTQGQLEYVTAEGELKTGCETEYVGAPSVDQYAVEYVLAHCARQAIKQGYRVKNTRLLTLDLALPVHPDGLDWTFENATALHQKGRLTDKEYGYIVASVDLNQPGN